MLKSKYNRNKTAFTSSIKKAPLNLNKFNRRSITTKRRMSNQNTTGANNKSKSKLNQQQIRANSSQLKFPTIHDIFNDETKKLVQGTLPLHAHPERLVTLWDQKQHLDIFDTYIFDFNGVISEHSGPALNALLNLNKKVIIASNNSHTPRSQFQAIFESIGVDLPLDNIFTAMSGAALFASQNKYQNVITIGNKALEEECTSYKIKTFPFVDHYNNFSTQESTLEFITKNNIQAILRSHSPQLYSLPEFTQTATPCDPTYRLLSFSNLPMISSEHLSTCNDFAARSKSRMALSQQACPTGHCTQGTKNFDQLGLISAKPSPLLYKLIQGAHPDIDTQRTLMIGDTISNDMGFASNASLRSTLVLTGKTDLLLFSKQYLPHTFHDLLLPESQRYLATPPTGEWALKPIFVAFSINELANSTQSTEKTPIESQNTFDKK